ncbi:MAG: hypothetical protein OEQ28_12855 [Acidobacteriota bacterium]|nr:hypothetical protein [Acidobacteriota bacterium]
MSIDTFGDCDSFPNPAQQCLKQADNYFDQPNVPARRQIEKQAQILNGKDGGWLLRNGEKEIEDGRSPYTGIT